MAGYVAKALHVLDLHHEIITIYLSTNGGSRPSALGIYDLIRACKSLVRIIAYGDLLSAGSLILQAGDERLLMPHTRMLVHPGASQTGSDKDSNTLAYAKEAVRSRDLMYTILAERMGIGLKECLSKYDDDNWFSAKQAVRLGLADRVL
jgi:ATP-dependent Clp protease protease subunit